MAAVRASARHMCTQTRMLAMLSMDQLACLSTGVYLAVAVWGARDICGGIEARVAVFC